MELVFSIVVLIISICSLVYVVIVVRNTERNYRKDMEKMKAKIYMGDRCIGETNIKWPDISFELSLEGRLKIYEQLLNKWLRRTGRMSKMIKALKGI